MTEIRTVRGPLSDDQLGWLARLYGPVDPKYASVQFLRHQFVDNPFGWSAHAFIFDGDDAVGHCAAIPFRATEGGAAVIAGKIEAVVIAPSHRGRRAESGGSLAVAMLSAMYAFAHECGIEILFGLAPPAVSALHARAGCKRVVVESPTYVLFLDPRTAAGGWSKRRRAGARVLAVGQNTLVAATWWLLAATTGARRIRSWEALREEDAELVAAESTAGTWTVSGADAWDWYAGSGVLTRAVVGGRHGAEAIVRSGHARGGGFQIVAWRPARPGLLPALVLLGALRKAAQREQAATLRFQPWSAGGGDGALVQACRVLGFARRPDAELVIHTADDERSGNAPVLTPFFYVTF